MMRLLMLGCVAVLMVGFFGCAATGPVTGDDLTLILTNDTDQEVDPNLYLSDSNVTADQLFTSANMYKNFNGKTTIPAKSSVTITISYAKAKTIGSNKAAFGSLTSWTGGKSADTPILHQEVDFNQASQITLRFTQDASKQYHTTAAVNPPFAAL